MSNEYQDNPGLWAWENKYFPREKVSKESINMTEYIVTNDNKVYAVFEKNTVDQKFILVASCPNAKCAEAVASGLGWRDSETGSDSTLEDFLP